MAHGTESGVKTALIVGGGIAGLSLAWALARRGVKVDLYEQGPLPNPISSSYDEHRINRHAYGRMIGYARLMPAAFRIWDEMWRDLGTSYYEETGGIYVLRQEDDWYDKTTESLTEMGIGFRDVPRSDLATRFPMLEPEGVLRTLEVEGSGLLYPVSILTALVARLAGMGVAFHACTRVSEVAPDRAELIADGRTYSADVLVVAAGAWVHRLVPELTGEVVVSRQAVLYLAPPAELASAWAAAPVIVVRDQDGSYTLPPRRGMRLKIGDHRFSRMGHADESRVATAEDLAALWRGLRKSYRHIERYSVLEPKACYYSVTDDEIFRVRPIGARGWVTSACSGHGFKLAPLISTGIAQAIVGEVRADLVEDWAAGRGSLAPV